LEKRANTKKHRLKTYKAKALKDFKNIKSLYSLMTKKNIPSSLTCSGSKKINKRKIAVLKVS